MFRTATVAMSFTYSSFAGVVFLMPLYLQTLRELTPLQSGLTTFPQALGAIVSSKLIGRLYRRVGPRRLIVFGMLAMSAVTLPLAFIGLHTSLWEIRMIMFARGICIAFLFVPLQARDLRQRRARRHRASDVDFHDTTTGGRGVRGGHARHRAH